MPSDAICVLHTQIPREPRTEPNEPRFRKILLGLVSVYWLLISVRSRSRPRSKKPDRYRFEPPNRYRAPSSLGSFAGLIASGRLQYYSNHSNHIIYEFIYLSICMPKNWVKFSSTLIRPINIPST